MHDRLHSFIVSQRNQLPADESNYFGLVFGDILKYHRYVLLIVERYRREGGVFFNRTKARFEQMRQAGPSVHRLTPEEEQEHEEGVLQTTQLHLEIESFFIFTSILLDRITGATQYYFGASSGQWKSLEAMKDHLAGYAKNKGLSVPPSELVGLTHWLHRNVSLFRHELLVHKHEDDYRARLSFATGFEMSSGETYLILGLSYPEEGEEPKIGEQTTSIPASASDASVGDPSHATGAGGRPIHSNDATRQKSPPSPAQSRGLLQRLAHAGHPRNGA
jgi:hypothetical protein